MPRFILRVDDVGWTPSKQKDVGLEYFGNWRKALGSCGVPVYYGAIPSCISSEELVWVKDSFGPGEELAVHGNTHRSREVVTDQDMKKALLTFRAAAPCRTYIPPFNDYTVGTIAAWGRVNPLGYFLGGFHEDHHTYGPFPLLVANTVHIPAYRPLYDHTIPLIQSLKDYLELLADCDQSPPVVVTLHCTWAHNEFHLLPRLMEILRPHLVSIDEASNWIERSGS